MNKLFSKSDSETRSFAAKLARETKPSKRAVVMGLVGDLGAGKTTFIQAFAKALGIRRRVLSPTFLISKRFKLPTRSGFDSMYHIDAYRITGKELLKTGLGEAMDKNNIILVEWADRVRNILPTDTIWLRFRHGENQGEREITINRR